MTNIVFKYRSNQAIKELPCVLEIVPRTDEHFYVPGMGLHRVTRVIHCPTGVIEIGLMLEGAPL